MNLILASSSPHRRELLARLQLPFQVITPNVDESSLPNEAPAELVERLSLAKARAVADQNPDAVVIGSDQVAAIPDTDPPAILGKPRERKTAIAQLRRLSGRRVQFLSGLCVIAPAAPPNASRDANTLVSDGRMGAIQRGEPGTPTFSTAGQDTRATSDHERLAHRPSPRDRDSTCELGVAVTEVAFRTLSETEISAYVDREQPFGCAASFRSERLGITLVEFIRGDDPSALIGLPLIRLCGMLRRAGLNPL